MLTTSPVHLAATQPEPSDNPVFPEQAAILKIGNRGQYWVINCCEFCKARHVHGAGPRGADPIPYLSHRSPHCLKNAPQHGYVLVATEDK